MIKYNISVTVKIENVFKEVSKWIIFNCRIGVKWTAWITAIDVLNLNSMMYHCI